MIIKIDYREAVLLDKINAFLSINKKQNITVKSENLPLGDIIICDTNGNEKIIIERKTLQDLAASIRDGRYKEQSFRLNECSMHNHNIVYLIEGNLASYKPFMFGKSPVDKYALMSSMISISYYKGFSLYKSNSLDESAEWIIQVAYKLDKEGGNAFYMHNNIQVATTENATTENATTKIVDSHMVADTEADKYSTVMKRTKKNNITPENIGEIILNQIPGVSSAVSIIIMEKFKTIKGLIEVLSKDKQALDGFKTVNKDGKSRKISKTSIQNIYSYLATNLLEKS